MKREAVKVLLESGVLLARSCRLKTISNESRQELPRFGTACGLVFLRRQAMELQTANVRRFMETTLQEQAGNCSNLCGSLEVHSFESEDAGSQIFAKVQRNRTQNELEPR